MVRALTLALLAMTAPAHAATVMLNVIQDGEMVVSNGPDHVSLTCPKFLETYQERLQGRVNVPVEFEYVATENGIHMFAAEPLPGLVAIISCKEDGVEA